MLLQKFLPIRNTFHAMKFSTVVNNNKLSLIGILGIMISSVKSMINDLLQPTKLARKKVIERLDSFVFPHLTTSKRYSSQSNQISTYSNIISAYTNLIENSPFDYSYVDTLCLHENLEEIKDIAFRKKKKQYTSSDNVALEKLQNTVTLKVEHEEVKNEEQLKTKFVEENDRPRYFYILFKKEISMLVRAIFLSSQEKDESKLRVILKRGDNLYTPLLNTDMKLINNLLTGRIQIMSGNLSNYMLVILVSIIIFLSFSFSNSGDYDLIRFVALHKIICIHSTFNMQSTSIATL